MTGGMFPDRISSKDLLRKILLLGGLLLLSACATNPSVNANNLTQNPYPIEEAQSIPYEQLVREATVSADAFRENDQDIHIIIENLPLALADVQGGQALAKLKEALETEKNEYIVTIEPTEKDEAPSVAFAFDEASSTNERRVANIFIETSANPDPTKVGNTLIASLLTAHSIMSGLTDGNSFDATLAGKQIAERESAAESGNIFNPLSLLRVD
jgi:hypothetical protein